MDRYHLLFAGELAEGQDLEAVKSRISTLLNIEQGPGLDRLFDGEPHILHHDLEREQVNEAFMALARTGAKPVIAEVVNLEPPVFPVIDSEPQTEPEPEPEPDFDSNPDAAPERGRPNLFALRLSERADVSSEIERTRVETFGIYPLLIVALVIVVGYLLSTFIWVPEDPVDRGGPEAVRADFQQNLYVRVENRLLKHDSSGLHLQTWDLDELGLSEISGELGLFGNGDILVVGVGATGAGMHRCVLAESVCSPFGLVASAAGSTADNAIHFTIDGNDTVYVSQAAGNTLSMYGADGALLALSKTVLDAPGGMVMYRGLLYLINQGDQRIVVALPDRVGFGSVLERRSLATEASSAAGHERIWQIARTGDKWWALLGSEDGNAVGLYLYDADWKPLRRVSLPDTVFPEALGVWKNSLLLADDLNRDVYRYDTVGDTMTPFSSVELREATEAFKPNTLWVPWMQTLVAILAVLLLAIVVALATINRLRKRVYIPPRDPEEALFNVNNPAIGWLGSPVAVRERIKLMGYAIVGLFLLILIGARIGWLPGVAALIMLVVCMASISSLAALYQATHCFIGVLGDKLVLVDHTNKYRVARTSRLQYRQDHLIIDDVIIYLGNRVQRVFDEVAIAEKIKPLVARGIGTDRATLQIKMIEARHPQIVAQAFAAGAAALAVLYLGVW